MSAIRFLRIFTTTWLLCLNVPALDAVTMPRSRFNHGWKDTLLWENSSTGRIYPELMKDQLNVQSFNPICSNPKTGRGKTPTNGGSLCRRLSIQEITASDSDISRQMIPKLAKNSSIFAHCSISS